MNDEFLEVLREEPRPAFADALWARINAPASLERNVPMATTASRPAVRFAFRPLAAGLVLLLLASAATLTFSSPARAALSDLWHSITGVAVHEQTTPNIADLTPIPAPSGSGSQGQPLPTAAPGEGLPAAFAEAMAKHRANGYKAPDSVGHGFVAEPEASANAGTVQGISEFRWKNASGAEVIFSVIVRPQGQTTPIMPVGVGSVTETSVNGNRALFIQGDWSQSPSGEWDPNAMSRVLWNEGNVEYQLATTDQTLGKEELVSIAKSAH